MSLFEKIFAKRLSEFESERKEFYEEKEKWENSLENIKLHIAKSREYRLMLESKQRGLLRREAKIESDKQKLSEQLSEIQHEKELLTQYKQEIHNIERNALVNIRRWERKEEEYIEDLVAQSKKLLENPNYARRKNGFKFEEYIGSLLRTIGYENVEVTKKTGDYGADIVADKDGLKYVFQCKYYSETVGIKAVQEVISAIRPYDADKGVVVTNAVFTTAARELAEAYNIELWDYSTLAKINDGKDFV